MKTDAEFGVVGAGSWGTALACLLAEHKRPVRLWCHNPKVAENIRHSGFNETYLPGIPLPPEVRATTDLADLHGCDPILIVVPSKALREVATALRGFKPDSEVCWISCTKGIEHGSGLLMTEILSEVLETEHVAVLSGPNHAIEVARKIPAAAVIGSARNELAEELRELFCFPTFRVYSSEDIKGIQLGGALKNVFAIGAGCSDGFSMGDNAKAALVTRSLAELTRLGIALGGKRETFFGLSGIGDLMVTCFSKHSRNRSFGERLGRGETPAAISESLQTVAEGVPTALSAWESARRAGVETPVLDGIYSVLYSGRSPREVMWELLGRSLKAESL
jgi:glycerol-3-phosphate dehydrogenase (NAD(P)+)